MWEFRKSGISSRLLLVVVTVPRTLGRYLLGLWEGMLKSPETETGSLQWALVSIFLLSLVSFGISELLVPCGRMVSMPGNVP